MKPIAALVALALAAGPAFAADKSASRPQESASGGATAPNPSFSGNASASSALFERLDKNKDGYLTGGELTSVEALTSNWLSVDRDGDGRIARSEFTAIGPAEGSASTVGSSR